MLVILAYIAWFFGGVFFANGLPHFVFGMAGRPFPTPFAKPPGRGESTAVANVLWGAFNLAVGYALIAYVSNFKIHQPWSDMVIGLGALAIALYLARNFGPLYGGDRSHDR